MDNKDRPVLSLKEPSKELPKETSNHARVEITLKLDKLPSKTVVNGKDTSFVVKDAKGHSYKVICKTKTFNKSQKTIAGFKHDYVISCSTKEFSINGKHVDMNQCGLQVFEKIPKAKITDSDKNESTESLNQT